MTSEQFAYWLQGFAELSPTPPTQAQWDLIREHLNLVFNKVTPKLANPTPAQDAVKKSDVDKAISNDAGSELKRLLEEAARKRAAKPYERPPFFEPQAPVVPTPWPGVFPQWVPGGPNPQFPDGLRITC